MLLLLLLEERTDDDNDDDDGGLLPRVDDGDDSDDRDVGRLPADEDVEAPPPPLDLSAAITITGPSLIPRAMVAPKMRWRARCLFIMTIILLYQ